jgi:hypothetical protein
MGLRFLIVDLIPGQCTNDRTDPLALLPVGPDRVAVALVDTTAEEALAELLARGLGIRRTSVVEA